MEDAHCRMDATYAELRTSLDCWNPSPPSRRLMKKRLRTGRIFSLSEGGRYGRLLVMRRMVLAIAMSRRELARAVADAEMIGQLLGGAEADKCIYKLKASLW